VGVQRQWCGPRGKGDHCLGGGCLGYVSHHDQVLLDFCLSLPAAWARDEQRRQACHVPPEVRYHIRQAQCLEMRDERSAQVPSGWVTGDDALGRHTRGRGELRQRGERYGLGGPCTTAVRALGGIRMKLSLDNCCKVNGFMLLSQALSQGLRGCSSFSRCLDRQTLSGSTGALQKAVQVKLGLKDRLHPTIC
jgi:hypothetical protein